MIFYTLDALTIEPFDCAVVEQSERRLDALLTLSAVRLIVPVGAMLVRCELRMPVVLILCCISGGSCRMNLLCE